MNFGAFQPYVGAGFAPLFSARTHDGFVTGVSVQPTVGAVLAAGADVMIDRHWGVNFNVKKIFASVTSTGTGIAPLAGRAFRDHAKDPVPALDSVDGRDLSVLSLAKPGGERGSKGRCRMQRPFFLQSVKLLVVQCCSNKRRRGGRSVMLHRARAARGP